MDSCEEIAEALLKKHMRDGEWMWRFLPLKKAMIAALQQERDEADEWEGAAGIIRRKTEDRAMEDRSDLEAELERLNDLLHNPHTDGFLDSVRIEAAHQRERWGSDHDGDKEPSDWFWLLGYLGGKALAAALSGNKEKALHHTISSGAVLLNWHAQLNSIRADG